MLEGKSTTARTRKTTRQRQAIVDLLQRSKEHPDAIMIYDEVRKTISNISLGTVYRILGDLHEDGEILELTYGSSLRRFDGRTDRHYHVTCLSCGRMDDVEVPFQADLDRQAGAGDFEVVEHRLEFYGFCSTCRQSR